MPAMSLVATAGAGRRYLGSPGKRKWLTCKPLLPYYVEIKGKRHLVVPYTLTYNDVRYVLPQGHSDPTSFFDYCRRGLDYLWDEGATFPRMMSIGLHRGWLGKLDALPASKNSSSTRSKRVMCGSRDGSTSRIGRTSITRSSTES